MAGTKKSTKTKQPEPTVADLERKLRVCDSQYREAKRRAEYAESRIQQLTESIRNLERQNDNLRRENDIHERYGRTIATIFRGPFCR